MQRFGLPLESCHGDAKRVRRCLVSGYWRNGARWMADGTFRSVRGNRVGVFFLTRITKNINGLVRRYLSTQRQSSLLENRGLGGSFFMRWKKPKGHKFVSLLRSKQTGVVPLKVSVSSSEPENIGYSIMATSTMTSTLA